MLPWVKASTRRIMLDRNRRMAAGRTATDSEALFEMLAMRASKHKGLSERELADSFGWSPGKLRRALAEWQADAEEEGDPDMAPERQTRPTNANQRRTTGESIANQRRINREPDANQSNIDTTQVIDDARTSTESATNQQRITDEPTANPTRARFLIEREIETETEKCQSTTSPSPECLSATPTHTLSLSDPAPAADPEDDADLCPAELIPAPARSTLPPLVLLPPGPVVVAQSESEPEDLLALLNALRTELHPPVLRADPNRLQGLALTDTRRAALTRGWTALGKVARPAADRRALLRLGVLYAYLSDSLAAQGARSTTEPIDTLLRKNHLTDYCERGRADAKALEARYAEILTDPTGDSSDPFNPAKHRRRA